MNSLKPHPLLTLLGVLAAIPILAIGILIAPIIAAAKQ